MEKLIVKKVSKITSNMSNILEDNIYKFAQKINFYLDYLNELSIKYRNVINLSSCYNKLSTITPDFNSIL